MGIIHLRSNPFSLSPSSFLSPTPFPSIKSEPVQTLIRVKPIFLVVFIESEATFSPVNFFPLSSLYVVDASVAHHSVPIEVTAVAL